MLPVLGASSKGEVRIGAVASEPETEDPKRNLADQKQTPDETIRLAYREIEIALAHDLLERIREAPPTFFERLIVFLLPWGMADQRKMRDALSGVRATMALLIKMLSAWTGFTFKQSVMQAGITSGLEQSVTSSADWIAIKLVRVCS
jgi:hypothetical protein